MGKHRSTLARTKWQRQRQQDKQRLLRMRGIKIEIDRTNWLIGRLDPQTNYKEVAKLKCKLRTLEQRLRYIGETST